MGNGEEKSHMKVHHRALPALLVDEDTTKLMLAARDGRPGWIARRTLATRTKVGERALGWRLAELVATGLLAERAAVDRRTREYALAPAGEGLIEVRDEVLAAAAAIDASGGRRAELLRHSIRDHWDPVILRVLVATPHRFNDLLRHCRAMASGPGPRDRRLEAGGLTSRLQRLEELGLVTHRPAERRGAVVYAPGPSLWRMARPALAASRWCSVYMPEQIPPMAGDLLGLVQMVFDRIPVVSDIPATAMVLYVDTPVGVWWSMDAALCVEEGRIHLLSAPPLNPIRVHDTVRGWDEALLSGSFERLQIEGDPAVAQKVLAALATPLRR